MKQSRFPYFYGQEQKVVESSRFKKAITSLFGATHIGERSRHQQLMKAIDLLPSVKSASVLNAGSANGAHSFYLAKRFPGWTILGVEIDKKKVENALKIKKAYGFSNVDFVAGDLQEIAYREQFDLIFSISVLNFIADEKGILERFHRALKPNGILILNVPSRPKKPILTFFKKKIEQQNDQEAMGSPLLEGKGFTNEELLQVADRTGFRTLELHNPCGRPGQLAWELSCGLEKHPLAKLALRPFLLGLTFLDQFAETRPYPENVDCLFIGQKQQAMF